MSLFAIYLDNNYPTPKLWIDKMTSNCGEFHSELHLSIENLKTFCLIWGMLGGIMGIKFESLFINGAEYTQYPETSKLY